ncbi:MAG: hypothetical protein ACI9KE_003805 [Polyangiales bacterium]|jgi:hypothetical protein
MVAFRMARRAAGYQVLSVLVLGGVEFAEARGELEVVRVSLGDRVCDRSAIFGDADSEGAWTDDADSNFVSANDEGRFQLIGAEVLEAHRAQRSTSRAFRRRSRVVP